MSKTRSVLWHLCTIFQNELNLANGQVMIYNRKKNVPPTRGMWITVGMLTGKVLANKNYFNDGIQYQSVNMVGTISVEIKSQDEEAFDRKEELVMAVKSTLAQSLQEKYAFRIGKIPSTPLVNLSEIEGAAIPFRFNLSFQVHYKAEKQSNVDYYDTFNGVTTSLEA